MLFLKNIVFILFFIVSNCLIADEYKVDLKLHYPKNTNKDLIIMFLGGSGLGGIPQIYDYKKFTSAGYMSIAVSYYGSENTNQYLKMVPLEYFENVINYIYSLPEAQNKKLIVIGTSRGGELALLIASKYPQIKGVIANVPSPFVFSGIHPEEIKLSAWSYNGKALDFIRPQSREELLNWLEPSNSNYEKITKATIRVHDINGSILLLSGKMDRVWPSEQMCIYIEHLLKTNNFKHNYMHKSYEDAGHTFALFNRPNMGGSDQGNLKAKEKSERDIFNFLEMISNKKADL